MHRPCWERGHSLYVPERSYVSESEFRFRALFILGSSVFPLHSLTHVLCAALRLGKMPRKGKSRSLSARQYKIVFDKECLKETYHVVFRAGDSRPASRPAERGAVLCPSGQPPDLRFLSRQSECRGRSQKTFYLIIGSSPAGPKDTRGTRAAAEFSGFVSAAVSHETGACSHAAPY